MACIKSVRCAALTAPAPDAPYLVAGTMSGAVDMSFSAFANIDIFRIDFQSDSLDLPLLASAPSPNRFNRLSWSRPGRQGQRLLLARPPRRRPQGRLRRRVEPAKHDQDDLRPAIDEYPEGVLSGEWPENFSLLSYADLYAYLESHITTTGEMSPMAKLGDVMSRPVHVATPG